MFESTRFFPVSICVEIFELHDSVEALACSVCNAYMGFSDSSLTYQNELFCRRSKNDFHEFFDEIYASTTCPDVLIDYEAK